MVRIDVWESRPSVIVGQRCVQKPGCSCVSSERGIEKWEQKVVVRLSEKLGDIDSSPEASFISRYTPTLFVTFGTALDMDNIKRLALQNARSRVDSRTATYNEVMYDPALCWIRGVTTSPQLVVDPFCGP